MRKRNIRRTTRRTALASAIMLIMTIGSAYIVNAKDKAAAPSLAEKSSGQLMAENATRAAGIWKAGISDYDQGSVATQPLTEAVTAAKTVVTSAQTKPVTQKITQVVTTAISKAATAPAVTTAVTTTRSAASTTATTAKKKPKKVYDIPFSSLYKDESTTEKVVPIKRDPKPSSESGTFLITTYGFGHGVGMSQNGANYHATYGGKNYREILNHYYTGAVMKKDADVESKTVTAGGLTGSVLEVVSGVVYNEMCDFMNHEAMKAQAVAAYTHILNKGCDDPYLRPQSDVPQEVVDVVKQVLGEYLVYNDEPIDAIFDSSGGGATASSRDIYGGDIPYLRSVKEEYDKDLDPYYGNYTVMTRDELAGFLTGNYGVDLPDDPSKWIKIVEGDGGYAKQVIIAGQETVRGSDFTDALGLSTAKFEIEYNN